MNEKRKRLITVLAIVLAILMVGSAAGMTISFIVQAATSHASRGSSASPAELSLKPPYSFTPLTNETPAFLTTEPTFILDAQALASNLNDPIDLAAPVLKDDYVTLTPTGPDPHYSPLSSLDTPVKYVVILYRTGNAKNTTLQFFIGSADTQPSDDSSMMEAPLVADGQWHTLAFDIRPLVDSGAYNGSNIGFFRLDPLETGYILNESQEPYKLEDGTWAKHPMPQNASIDIRFIAFFESEDLYQGFDADQYVAKRDYEQASRVKHDWMVPGYIEMETTPYDKDEGSLKLEPSPDGSTLTISYDVNGETVSYTVPNKHNYTMGSYAATDDLNRSMYTSMDLGAYGSTGERYVGLFYFLWHGEHGDDGIFDLQKIIDRVGVEAAGSTNCGLYGPEWAMHWFAEPLYGYYYANDAWIHRKHAELLTQANIDFLYFDVTNGFHYLGNALGIMKCLHELNEQGFDAPQVVFYTNSSAESVIQVVYDYIYSKGLYEDTWFKINGKPVMIGPEEANVNDFFLMKQNQWPTEGTKKNSWPWMDFRWPNRTFPTKYDFDGPAISVSIAQHSGSIAFSDSSLYNNPTNRGRSFWTDKGATNAVRVERYNEWKADPSLTNQGLNFQAQFDTAIGSNAMYILVTGWNEWVAMRQGTGNDRIWFVDAASMEFSRDAEMMRGGYFDNYYIQLAYNVQRVKGAAPILLQDARHPINVTGDFAQWDEVTLTYRDIAGDTVDRYGQGFGNTIYENNSGRNDIVAAKVTADTKNLYFYVECAAPISMYDNDTSWMKLYIDADSDASTGWYGYDYIINYKAQSELVTTVARYNGTDNAYSFEEIGEIPYRIQENRMMLSVPQELLGMKGYRELCFQFKWADSRTVYDEMEDFYCDGDVAPLGRMNYVFQNYIPGVSNISYPESETTAEPPAESTTPPTTSPVTVPSTEEPTETQAPGKGCGSSLASGVAGLLGLMLVVGSALLRRSKD